ncbi:MAG: inositol-3-phosphate synthase [Candidatus Helarchaeota archaeon]
MGKKIRVAIAGLGNCAKSLIEGVHYYRNASDEDFIPGLMHVNFGGYRPRDIEFVAAFEINTKKIGRDINEAIYADPNCAAPIIGNEKLPKAGFEVLPGPISDGCAPHMKEAFHCYDPREIQPVDVAEVLRSVKADMLINYLPVGSNEGARIYAQAALDAGVGFINCIPEFIVSDDIWAKKFEDAGLPIAGDDIKSQVGATILHRVLVDLLVRRGVKVEETYQLNIGGNTDFLNMTDEGRLRTKRISKTEAVTSQVPYEIPVRIGPSDYVEFLGDKKICYIHIKGKKFGDQPIYLNVKLSVEDSPNSAGVVIDVIRAMKLALDRKIAGRLISISSYAFKHPPVQYPDAVAYQMVEDFINGKRDR